MSQDQYLKIQFVLDFISDENYRKYNVVLAKRLGGIEYAILLTDLIDMFKYLSKNKMLVSHIKYGDGLMYYTQTQAYDRCGINKDSFTSGKQKLIDIGLISDVVRFGMPPRNYFRLNFITIYDFIISNNVSKKRNSANQLAETRQLITGNPLPDEKYDESKKESKDRSFSRVEIPTPNLSPSSKEEIIASFDPFKFVLLSGEYLKDITARSLTKKMKDPKLAFLIRTNVSWYLKNAIGKKIDNHEAYLQNAISQDYAGKEDNKAKNQLYARFMREEHNLSGIKILKTVVQLEKQSGVPCESINYNLPEKTFCDAIDNYVKYYKNK